MKKQFFALSLLSCALVSLVACSGKKSDGTATGGSAAATDAPSFTLAWSEYPSWSVFGVADEQGLIDGKEGEQGEIELRWNVVIVLNLADYDTCITQYGTSEAVAASPCVGEAAGRLRFDPSHSQPATSGNRPADRARKSGLGFGNLRILLR